MSAPTPTPQTFLKRTRDHLGNAAFTGLIALLALILTGIGVVFAYLTYKHDLSTDNRLQSHPTTPAPQPDGKPPTSTTPSSLVDGSPVTLINTSPPSSPRTTSPTPKPASTLFNDRISLQTSDAINLDTGSTRIAHNLVSDTDGDGGYDLYVDGYASSALKGGHLNGKPQQFFKTEAGTMKDCVALIQRNEDPIWDLQASISSGRYCFLTSEGRLAVVRLYGRHNGRTDLGVTVWDRFLEQ